jgi:head-tail adaptor
MVSLVHPRMMTMLQPLYPSVCTIQESTEVQDAAGQLRDTWADKPGYVAISCRVGPVSGGERKSPRQVYTVATHTVALAGYYSGITTKMRAVVDGTLTLDILLPQSDSTLRATQLVCQVVT